MVQRPGCGSVCTTPAACGVGGLGVAKKRCAQHPFLAADHGELRLVCQAAGGSTISGGSGFLCFGYDGQADACDLAVCVAAYGLLAAEPLSVRSVKRHRRKIPAMVNCFE